MCTLQLMFKVVHYHSRRTDFRLFFIWPRDSIKGSKSESSAKEVWFPKSESINLPKFKNDLRTSELLPNTPKHLVDLVNCFNTTLKSITDKHASWRKRSMTLSDEIRSAKRHRRIAELNWRSTKSEQSRNKVGTKLSFLWISLVMNFTQILSATFLVINASFLLLQI